MNKLILMYHGFGKGDKYTLPYRKLIKDIQILKKKGYSFFRFKEINKKNKKSVSLTFDDGYSSNYQASKILDKFDIKGTFFIKTSKIGNKGYLSKEQIKEINNNKHEIGSHTVNHLNLTTLNDKKLKKELIESKKTLERLTKSRIESISIPGGVYNKKILRECLRHYNFVRTSDVEIVDYLQYNNIYPSIPLQKRFQKYYLSKNALDFVYFVKRILKIKDYRGEKGNAIFHVHTIYSDGKYSLGELKNWCKNKRINIVFLADHAEYFDNEKLKKYKKECKILSNSNFIFIPGLELASKTDCHIIHLNPKEIPNMEKNEIILKKAKKKGVKIVIAHVNPKNYPRSANLIEILSAKQNPKTICFKTFMKINKMRRENPYLNFIGGCDMHELKNENLVRFNLDFSSNIYKLINSFCREEFYFCNNYIGIDSEGEIYGNKKKILLELTKDLIKTYVKNKLRKIKILRQIYHKIK